MAGHEVGDIDEVHADYLLLGGVVTEDEFATAARGDFMVWASKPEEDLCPDALLPQLVEPLDAGNMQVLIGILVLAHRQSTAVHCVLGPKGEHPYMLMAANAAVDAWGVAESILKSDQSRRS